MDSIREILRRGIASRAFPGAAVAMGDADRIEVVCEGWHGYVSGQGSPLLRPQDSASGSLGGGGEGLGERFSAELPTKVPSHGTGEVQGGGAGWQSSGDPDAGKLPAVHIQTLYDLASLTKILATTQAAMALDLDPELPASTWLHEWRGGEKALITVRQLMDHSAGLPAFRRYDEKTLDAQEAERLILAEPLEVAPGTRTLYSDLGPILIGLALERIEAGALRRYGEGPGLTFCPPPEMVESCPPTEPVEDWRRQMWQERQCATDRSVEIGGVAYLRGEVHDPRAALLGGVAGHAGLFGTAQGVAHRVQGWLRAHLAGDPTMRRWTSPSVPGSHRALGFDLDPGEGIRLSPHAFGHYGFTGTMAWVEPERERFVVMLSNRIHPSAANVGHRASRAEILALLD
ncbi:MAG: beta-lactamase family protein [Fimbriimonadaceae bacterium]|nr:beta-lactamase family protein [Fimbriimonadaceae bacterium]